jgi:RNA polymerase sigma factor (sigma-70 family)
MLEEEGLEWALTRYGPTVTRLLRFRFGDALSNADLEDVLSIALFRLWGVRERIDEKRPLFPYFYTVAKRAAIDVLRRRQSQPLALESVESVPSHSSQDKDEEEPAVEDYSDPLREDLRASLATLNGLEREILEAYTRNDHSERWAVELSERVGIDASTLRVMRFRAVQKLRKQMRQRGYDVPGGT